jgi:hypothetical protein
MRGNKHKNYGLNETLHLRISRALKTRLIAEASLRSKVEKPVTPSDIVREMLEAYFLVEPQAS